MMSPMMLVEEVNNLCEKCQNDTRATVRVWCVLCDSWCHGECVGHTDFGGKSQKDIEAMDVDFFFFVRSVTWACVRLA